jgi:hypothetical protein
MDNIVWTITPLPLPHNTLPPLLSLTCVAVLSTSPLPGIVALARSRLVLDQIREHENPSGQQNEHQSWPRNLIEVNLCGQEIKYSYK